MTYFACFLLYVPFCKFLIAMVLAHFIVAVVIAKKKVLKKSYFLVTRYVTYETQGGHSFVPKN
jgi:hypothetical protein